MRPSRKADSKGAATHKHISAYLNMAMNKTLKLTDQKFRWGAMEAMDALIQVLVVLVME